MDAEELENVAAAEEERRRTTPGVGGYPGVRFKLR